MVETTPLEPILDLDRAVAPDAARARFERPTEEAGASGESQHAAVGGGAEEFTPDEPVSDNVVARSGYRRGDVAAALAGCDVIVEGRFATSWVHQGYLEPQVAMAELDEDGILHITSATQGTFHTRSELAKLFGRSIASVRVTGATLGGGFGGKLLVIEPLAAAATLVLRRPVRVELTRLEDFRMTNPAPASILEVALGAHARRPSPGLRARLLFETGGFSENSVEGIAAILTVGPYHWDAHEIVAYGVETNRVGTGAYRAPGAPQATFALEQLLDELAGRLEIDPIELRRRNLVAPDDEMADGTPWGGIGLDECLVRLADHPLYRDRASLPDGEGVGIAVGAWPGGRQPASAICRLEADGRVTVVTGVVDMSGTMTGFATIAAEGLGIAADDVSVVAADTASATRSPVSGGSVITYSTGRAVQRATDALREKILAYAAILLEIDVRDLELVDGSVQPKGTPERGMTPGRDRRIARRLLLRLRAAGRPRRHGPARPGAAHLGASRPRPGRPRDRRGRRPRLRHRPGRRPGAQPGDHRGPAPWRRDAGSRLGAPRGDGPRRERAAADRHVPRLRDADRARRSRPSRPSSSRCRRPTVRTARRGSARVPSAARPRRSPTPSPTRPGCVSASCR